MPPSLSENLTIGKHFVARFVRSSRATARASDGYAYGMPKVVRSDVVRRLRAIRAELGLSPPEMAERLGVSRTTYYNWEAENPTKPNFPAEEAMAKLCDLLRGLTLDYIYMGRVDTLPTGLAIRLTARELGEDPGSPGFRPERAAAVVAEKVAS